MKKLLLFVVMMMVVLPVHGLEDIKYKYYRLNKVLGPIVSLDEISNDYPLIDKDNPIEGKLSELSPIKPQEKEERQIFEYDGYEYLEIPNIDSLDIELVKGTSISNIRILTKNGDIETESSGDNIIYKGEKKNFKIKDKVYLEDLIIQVTTAPSDEQPHLEFYFKSDDKIVSTLYSVTLSDFTVTNYGDQSVLSQNMLEKVYFTEKQDSDKLIYKGNVKLYQYFDYKYQTYRLEKDYYPEYLSEPFEDYIYRDDSDFIVENIEENVTDVPQQKEVTSLNKIEPINNIVAKKTINNIPQKIADTKNIPNEANDLNKQIKTSSSIKEKPVQYNKVLKANNKNNSSSKTYDNKIITYFMLLFLIILLLLMLKIRKQVKNDYR